MFLYLFSPYVIEFGTQGQPSYIGFGSHTGTKILNSSKNSHFENLTFHEIQNFQVSFFTKFTFSKPQFFTKFTFFKRQILGNFWIKNWFLSQCGKQRIFSPKMRYFLFKYKLCFLAFVFSSKNRHFTCLASYARLPLTRKQKKVKVNTDLGK